MWLKAREMLFPAIWGVLKPKIFLYAPRQAMLALRLDSLPGSTYLKSALPHAKFSLRPWVYCFL